MLYYDTIGVSEGTDVNKTSASKECNIWHYWYFLNYSFKVQPNDYNRHHDLLMMSMNLDNIAILNIKGSYCHGILHTWLKKVANNKIENYKLNKM